MGSMLRLGLMAMANADLIQRVQTRAAQVGKAAGLAMDAFLLSLIMIAFLFQALSAWLALHVGPIWAPLIVAGVLLVLVGVLLLVAYLMLHKKAEPKRPAATAELPSRALAALPD